VADKTLDNPATQGWISYKEALGMACRDIEKRPFYEATNLWH